MERVNPEESSDPGVVPGEALALLEGLEEGVLELRDGAVRWVNPALARMLARPRSSCRGLRLSDLFSDAEGRPVDSPGSTAGLRLRDAHGSLRPVSVQRVNERAVLVVDRSREARLEREVWRLAAELRRSAGEPDPASPLAAEIPGMIEHEIRTACTVIRGYIRMLAEERVGPANAAQKDFLGEMRRGTDRISALLDNLLAFAQLGDEPAFSLVRKPTSIHLLVERALAAVRPLMEERGIRATLELEGEIDDQVDADADQLEQIFINLLSNAAKFAPTGSEVRVASHLVESDGIGQICVSVQDEGPGVAADDVDRIFLPFVQGAGPAGAASNGVGLGLAICRKLAAAHGGSVDAVAALGYGLFRLTVPLER